MTRIKSENFFHAKPENLNCAQSVLKSFQKEFNIQDEVIEEFRAFGGGRAPEGTCGALFAADFLIKKLGKDSIKSEFIDQVGSYACLDIKRKNKVPCLDCVRIADELLEKKSMK